ncbi:MAG TPA: MFS transporter [Cytophagales bacterium]|nr:MFS transporter [Cytophagales bacterium]HAA19620.1 MFS transporter [Cytophagales bacterium]HAP58145.1 MFS transporter [Cytophagales bacterium]
MNKSSNSVTYRIALAVTLGGFLFGFDASVISGVIGYVTPQFNLELWQQGMVVGSPTLAAMFAVLFIPPLSDVVGRRKMLLFAAVLYAVSAFFSAIAPGFWILVFARMIGGIAFGAALVLAPIYIGEIAPSEMRGKLVSIQQLNIVIGFSASYFSNYYLLQMIQDSSSFLNEFNGWRWMLGVEIVPAVLYLILLFWVPRSPRWLIMKGRVDEAKVILAKIFSPDRVNDEFNRIQENFQEGQKSERAPLRILFSKELRLIVLLGVVLAVVQQITGINSILFYAPAIFEQSGVGKNAAFMQAILVGLVQVVFTVVTMMLIDRVGRKPLMQVGLAGIALSMAIVSFGFYNATYQFNEVHANEIGLSDYASQLAPVYGTTYTSDLIFKNELKDALGTEVFMQYESQIMERAADMNAILILAGILMFMAAFSLSVGPVMWVLFSEIFPTKVKGIALAVFGFINSGTSYLVQQIFPWEINTLGNTTTYLLFGVSAVIGFIILARYLPETKNKNLEELEKELVKA